jgi:predicted nucleic acid-binding protein
VIVLDANILLYAYDADAEKHAKARAWVEELFSGASPRRIAVANSFDVHADRD